MKYCPFNEICHDKLNRRKIIVHRNQLGAAFLFQSIKAVTYHSSAETL